MSPLQRAQASRHAAEKAASEVDARLYGVGMGLVAVADAVLVVVDRLDKLITAINRRA